METQQIGKQIFENNDWVNGNYDFRDGDLAAKHNAKDRWGKIITVEYAEEAAELLLKWNSVNVRYNDLIFVQHWNYGCFVYKADNPFGYFEHYSTHLFEKDRLAESIEALDLKMEDE